MSLWQADAFFFPLSFSVRWRSTLRRVFQKAHQMVEERFNEKGYQLIGGFFFLRFVCPALVSPERVGLASGTRSNPPH